MDAYERRMLQLTRGALPGFSGILRRHSYCQAQMADAGLLGGALHVGVCGALMALTVLVCYDISRDAAWARVAAYLQQWGDRIQRSVFVCALAPEDLDEMVSRSRK